MPEVTSSRYLVTAGWRDVPHLSDETQAELLASTPPHLRDARAKGTPALGSGAVFPIDEALITEVGGSIPLHWARICGLDFGWDHPTAAVWIAWDRDTDTIHVYDAYRVSEQPVVVHAAALRAKGSWIPVAWPHDGLQHDKGAGIELAQQYRAAGVNMCAEMAKFPPHIDGSTTPLTSVEAGLSEMLNRMITGRFKVASHLAQWFEEFRMYHRKDGRVVKVYDDLLSATRYGMMMLRFAVTEIDKCGAHQILHDTTLQSGRRPATRSGY